MALYLNLLRNKTRFSKIIFSSQEMELSLEQQYVIHSICIDIERRERLKRNLKLFLEM